MNRKKPLACLSLVSLLAWSITLTGCATAPTPGEHWMYNITTNHTPQVVLVTNAVPVIVEKVTYVTNQVAGQVTVSTTTNQIVSTAQTVTPMTNWTAEVLYEPNQNAAKFKNAGEAIGSLFGVGGIVGTSISGLIALWGTLRSRRVRKTAAVLAQGVETARAILRDTPQGQDLDAEFVAWLEKHQSQQNVLKEVLPLLKTVSPEFAALVAERLKRSVPVS